MALRDASASKNEKYKDTTGDDIYKQDTTQMLDECYNFNFSMIMD